MIIGFDIDGVLADFATELARRLCNYTLRKEKAKATTPKITYENFTSYWVVDAFGIPNEVGWELTKDIHEENVDLEVLDDGQIAWHTARSWGVIPYVITSRDIKYRPGTARWLVSHRFYPTTLYMGATNKLQVARGLGVTHFVEDNPETALLLAYGGIRTCMPIRPWTKNSSIPEELSGVLSIRPPFEWLCAEIDREEAMGVKTAVP